MTEKPFKFRYTNEIVGSFVLVSLILMIAGIFIAGRAQGWFERKATLHTIFNTEKGAFGLREGDEVLVRDTVAGNLGKIVPMADGTIQTTFNMKYQFLANLKKDSVAKVRKKFGFAGDSVVDILPGKTGKPLKDGDFIECQKDEELMETAKKALTDAQDVVMPIMKEFKDVLANINKIATEDIRNGHGLVGTILKDEKLANDVKKVVGNVNALLLDTRDTVSETRKLIRGVQKHWLWRRYMDKDKDPEFLLHAGLVSPDIDPETRYFKSELETARAANDPVSMSMNAYNLAVCELEKGNVQEALPLVQEARAELVTARKDTLCTFVLEAQILKKAGRIKEALAVAKTAETMMNRSTDRAIELQSRVVTAELMKDDGDIAGARSASKKILSLADKLDSPVVKSMAAGFMAGLLIAEDKPAEAAARYDMEADLLKTAGLYEKMAQSLAQSGKAYALAGDHSAAADRYFRSGRSLFSSGITVQADENLKKAADMAKMANDPAISSRILAFKTEMEKAAAVAE